MPGRERERDSPDSRSALVESKAGKRQKPAPCPFPAGAFSTLARTGRYEIGFFAYLHAQGSVKDAMCNFRNIAMRPSVLTPVQDSLYSLFYPVLPI